jgi:tripeptide aminopeptidase
LLEERLVDNLLDRFLRYVKVETTAVEDTDKYPSSAGQLELGRMLAEEMRAIGLADVNVSEAGVVMGTLPGNVPGAPTIAWLAHQDTSPESSAKDVKPNVIKNYDGKDIVLSGDKTKVIKVSETDGMAGLKGKTLITTDGTTLLGADDKAGVAVIMTAAETLMKKPELKHGPVRVVFTVDEEVGRGTDKVDIGKIGAIAAYTLDGEAAAGIENETFSADMATVTITGVNIHPGFAKGRMVNAIRLAGQFLTRLPWHRLAPETTEKREPFFHPYVLEGGVPEAKIRILLRSFNTADLAEMAKLLQTIATTLEAEHPRAKIAVEVKKQYRNMLEHLKKEPRAVSLAVEAYKRIGVEPQFQSIRGGTDGSRLSEMGLPTPNLSTGMHNFHSPLEFACLEQMETSVRALVELAQLWGQQK